MSEDDRWGDDKVIDGIDDVVDDWDDNMPLLGGCIILVRDGEDGAPSIV
jgi:hypothetical protein